MQILIFGLVHWGRVWKVLMLFLNIKNLTILKRNQISSACLIVVRQGLTLIKLWISLGQMQFIVGWAIDNYKRSLLERPTWNFPSPDCRRTTIHWLSAIHYTLKPKGDCSIVVVALPPPFIRSVESVYCLKRKLKKHVSTDFFMIPALACQCVYVMT